MRIIRFMDDAGQQRLVDGRCDDIEAVHFLYKGDLEEVRRVARES